MVWQDKTMVMALTLYLGLLQLPVKLCNDHTDIEDM